MRCKHVNFVDKNDKTVSNGENEFLFAPYSVFTVRKVEWHPAPKVGDYGIDYHTIHLDVAPDNAAETKKEKLTGSFCPNAPWA